MDDSVEFVSSSLVSKLKKSNSRTKNGKRSPVFSRMVATIPVVESDCLLPNANQCKCIICEKDLTKLDEIRRSLHINNCLDEQEAKLKFEKDREKWNATIDCPMCGRSLPPGPFRITHAKQCSRKYDMEGSKLLTLMEAQLEVSEIRKRHELNHTKKDPPTLGSKRPKCLKIGPKSEFDEQLDIAKAISASSMELFDERDDWRAISSNVQKALPKTSRSNNSKSFSIMQIEPYSCKCSVFDEIQSNFLSKFKLKRNDTIQSAIKRRLERTIRSFDDIGRCFDKLKRLEQLSIDMYRMSSINGDITIFSFENEALTIHKFILAARAPKLLEMAGDSTVLLLQEYKACILRCYIKYLYSAAIEWTLAEESDIIALAEKFGPTELKHLCNHSNFLSMPHGQVAVSTETALIRERGILSDNFELEEDLVNASDKVLGVSDYGKDSEKRASYSDGDIYIDKRRNEEPSVILIDDSYDCADPQVVDSVEKRGESLSCVGDMSFCAGQCNSSGSDVSDRCNLFDSEVHILSDSEEQPLNSAAFPYLRIGTKKTELIDCTGGGLYGGNVDLKHSIESRQSNSHRESKTIEKSRSPYNHVSSVDTSLSIEDKARLEPCGSVTDVLLHESLLEPATRLHTDLASCHTSFSTPVRRPCRMQFQLKQLGSAVKIIKTVDVTPSPNYAVMADKELKEQLARYGVRPLGRKRAITMLQMIYEETHPLLNNLMQSHQVSDNEASNNDASGTEDALTSSPNADDILEESYVDECCVIPLKDLNGMRSAFLNWIRRADNKELHNALLTLKPISLNELYDRVSCADTAVSQIPKRALIEILDELHVTFTIPSERRRRKPAKKIQK